MEKVGSLLTIRTYAITELSYGDKNLVNDKGSMVIDPSYSQVLLKKYPFITDIKIRIIRPTEHDQHTNTIMDVIPISTKALGRLGEGITNTLGGIYVLLTGADEAGRQVCNFGASDGILSEHICYGKAGTPERDDLLISFDVIVKKGSWSEREVVLSMHKACDDFLQIFRMQMKKFNPRTYTERHDFQEWYSPDRKDVAIFKEVSGQGSVYETLLFPNEPSGVEGGVSDIDMHWMPVILTPNEYRDGALHALD